MDSRKSIRKLGESIRCILGLKSQLTSTWADSVCNIIKDLPYEEGPPPIAASSDNGDLESYTSAPKILDHLAALNDYLNQLSLQRRQALTHFLDLKGNIRVFCRVRPSITHDDDIRQPTHAVSSDSNNVYLKLSQTKTKRYSFDKVFHPASSQDEVFAEVEPVIKSALDGYNACIFAYGQTGTGKTFTMEGEPDSPGVVPRAIEALFEQAVNSNHKIFFTFSMFEIYMGCLRDLLIPHRTKPTDPMSQGLMIQTDPNGGIEIENLVTIRVSDFTQAKRLYGLGSRFRSTASTNSNATSSRSHCLTRISLSCFDAPDRRRITNKVWMVDLGGSERVLKTKTWGRRFEEGKYINLSLSALGDVISALQRKKPHVPYRNSKLTQVLRDSLGEDSRTLMLVHVSPKEEDLCETVCSLGFATRVRSIHLGSEETSEVQARKEISMAKLLQKVKQLEKERQDVTEKVKKLKEKLEYLTRKEPSSDEWLEDHHLVSNVQQNNIKMEGGSAGNATSSPSVQFPRFMRPTICSRRKFGIDHPTKILVQKKCRIPTRRKTSSVCAESVSFPLKGISEYGSECSISKTSCLTDYGTEYNHNASECDIKMVVTVDSSERNPAHAKPHLNNKISLDCDNGKGGSVDFTKCLTVDEWLRVQKNEPTNTCVHGNKRVLAISVLENKIFSSQNKANTLQPDEVCNHECKKKIFNHDEVEKLMDVWASGRSTEEVVISQIHNLLDTSVSEDSWPDPVSPYDEAMEGRQGLLEYSGDKDDRCHPILSSDMRCDELIQNKDCGLLTQKVVIIDETVCSRKTSFSKANGHNIINLNEKFRGPIPECDLELQSQNPPTEVSNGTLVNLERIAVTDQEIQTGARIPDKIISIQENKKVDFCDPSWDTEAARRPCLYNMQCRKVLTMGLNDVDQDHTLTFVEFNGKAGNPGAFDLVGQKVHILCSGALLGLGFQNLGLGEDFYYSLIL